MATRRRLAIVLSALVVGSVCFVTGAGAGAGAGAQQQPGQSTAQQSALSVSPGIVDNTLDPGTAFEFRVAVSNLTASPVAVRSSARELVPNEEIDPEYQAVLDESEWFAVDVPDFVLLAQERREVTVRVAVPTTAEPGGHYATINFDSFVPAAQSEGATSVNARIGVVVLLTVNGEVREDVSVVGPVSVGETIQTEALPTRFGLTLHNEGNVHALPQGRLVVRDVFGRRVEELQLPEQTLLPGSRREVVASWERGLVFGIFNVEAELTYGESRTQLEVPSTRFAIFPLVVVIPVATLIALIAGFVFVQRRRRRRASVGIGATEPKVEE